MGKPLLELAAGEVEGPLPAVFRVRPAEAGVNQVGATDRPDLSVLDERPGLAHRRAELVLVDDADRDLVGVGQFLEVVEFGQRLGRGLLDDDRDPRRYRRLGQREVRLDGRTDVDDIEVLAGEQLFDIEVVGDVVVLGHPTGPRLVQVTDRHERGPRGPAGCREMLLGDRSSPDDCDIN